MTNLEQRLAKELGAVATGVQVPDLAVGGLVATGRRERVRRQAGVAGLVAAAVAVVAVAAGPGLAGGDDRAVDSGGSRRMPWTPPVSFSGRLMRLGVTTASANVASARYSAERRSAGMPSRFGISEIAFLFMSASLFTPVLP